MPGRASNGRIVHDPEGLNAGPRPAQLANGFVTPGDHFFTRSHAPVPAIDPAAWRLEVGGLVERPAILTLETLLRDFPERRTTATLVCAGLRRADFLALGPLSGELPWGSEAISTGDWAGVALADVLRRVGLGTGARYVEFEGLDQVLRHGRTFGFGGSIAIEAALQPDVLLATKLNGHPLPPRHGFPLRAVVPGWIAARSVKWLGRITVGAKPSSNYFQTEAYRLQRTANPKDPRDVTAGAPLAEVPVNSAILGPAEGERVAAGTVRVHGWAMGSGGSPVGVVEISPNAGADWVRARVTHAGAGRTWVLWETEFTLDPGIHTIVVRATDVAGKAQPASLHETWNVKGYCNNAWHRVAVQIG